MGYLKTVITYNQPSEAEVDKAFLESYGLTVCLLNANTSRNELGAPFYIQLQVVDEEYQHAVELLREANPQRFGSTARVAEIERAIFTAIGRFLCAAIPVGMIVYFVVPKPDQQYGSSFDWRFIAALAAAVLAGNFAARRKKKP